VGPTPRASAPCPGACADQLRWRVADIRFALDQLQRLADQGLGAKDRFMLG